MSEIAFSRPWFGEEEERAVTEVLRSGWVVGGPRLRDLEAGFAAAGGAAKLTLISVGEPLST